MTFNPKARYFQGNDLMVDYTPVGAVAAGDVVVIGSQCYIAKTDIAAAVLGALSAPNSPTVYIVVKDTSTFTAATPSLVYWDNTAKKATTTSGGNSFMGIALGDAATGDATVTVLRLPITAATSFVPGGLSNAIADPGNAGAVPVTSSGNVQLVTAGAETRTIAAPAALGIRLLLDFVTKVGNCVVTVASTINSTGNNTISLTAAGQSIELTSVKNGGSYRWAVAYNDGTTLSTV